jgi:hypothetical protein
MCLHIKQYDYSRCENRNIPQRRPKKPVMVYKYYKPKYEPGSCALKKGWVISPFQDHTFFARKGKIVESSRKNTALASDEKKRKVVRQGFHGYLNKEDCVDRYDDNRIIVEFIGQPEDFVAIGIFCHKKSVVFTKLTVNKIYKNENK